MITEDTVVIGETYTVFGSSANLGLLVGRAGIAKWANYRGVCLKFSDGSAYVVPFDCLVVGNQIQPKKSLFRTHPTATNCQIGLYKYRLSKMPDNNDVSTLGRVGTNCKLSWVSGTTNTAAIVFENCGCSAVVPLDCLEDLST